MVGIYLCEEAGDLVVFHGACGAQILHEPHHGRVANGVKIVFSAIFGVFHQHRQLVEVMQWVPRHIALYHVLVICQKP